MHEDTWQKYDLSGAPLPGAGHPSVDGNPPLGADFLVMAAGVWLYRRTETGVEILFQKRSKLVDRNPDLWDVSAAGHVDLGETVFEAAVREAREEIGAEIQASELQFVVAKRTIRKANIVNYQFLVDYTGRPEDFHFDDQEVSEVKWVPLAEMEEFIEQGAKPPLKNQKDVIRMVRLWLEKV